MKNQRTNCTTDPSAEHDSPSKSPSSTEGAVDSPLTPPSLSDHVQMETESVRASERPANADQPTAVEVLDQSGDAAPVAEEEQEIAELRSENSVPL